MRTGMMGGITGRYDVTGDVICTYMIERQKGKDLRYSSIVRESWEHEFETTYFE